MSAPWENWFFTCSGHIPDNRAAFQYLWSLEVGGDDMGNPHALLTGDMQIVLHISFRIHHACHLGLGAANNV